MDYKAHNNDGSQYNSQTGPSDTNAIPSNTITCHLDTHQTTLGEINRVVDEMIDEEKLTPSIEQEQIVIAIAEETFTFFKEKYIGPTIEDNVASIIIYIDVYNHLYLRGYLSLSTTLDKYRLYKIFNINDNNSDSVNNILVKDNIQAQPFAGPAKLLSQKVKQLCQNIQLFVESTTPIIKERLTQADHISVEQTTVRIVAGMLQHACAVRMITSLDNQNRDIVYILCYHVWVQLYMRELLTLNSVLEQIKLLGNVSQVVLCKLTTENVTTTDTGSSAPRKRTRPDLTVPIKETALQQNDSSMSTQVGLNTVNNSKQTRQESLLTPLQPPSSPPSPLTVEENQQSKRTKKTEDLHVTGPTEITTGNSTPKSIKTTPLVTIPHIKMSLATTATGIDEKNNTTAVTAVNVNNTNTATTAKMNSIRVEETKNIATATTITTATTTLSVQGASKQPQPTPQKSRSRPSTPKPTTSPQPVVDNKKSPDITTKPEVMPATTSTTKKKETPSTTEKNINDNNKKRQPLFSSTGMPLPAAPGQLYQQKIQQSIAPTSPQTALSTNSPMDALPPLYFTKNRDLGYQIKVVNSKWVTGYAKGLDKCIEYNGRRWWFYTNGYVYTKPSTAEQDISRLFAIEPVIGVNATMRQNNNNNKTRNENEHFLVPNPTAATTHFYTYSCGNSNCDSCYAMSPIRCNNGEQDHYYCILVAEDTSSCRGEKHLFFSSLPRRTCTNQKHDTTTVATTTKNNIDNSSFSSTTGLTLASISTPTPRPTIELSGE